MLLRALKSAGESLARVLGPWRVSETPGILYAGSTSAAGVQVDEESALSLSGVFAAVNLLSRLTGSLPLYTYRRDGRLKNQARDLPIYNALAAQANPEMTASIGRTVMEWHRLLGGAACAEIGWRGDGQAEAYWPLESWRVEPKRDEKTDDLYYLVDGTRKVQPADMVYVPLISHDGVCGRSFIEYACESLGIAIATQEHAGAYFGNGARPGVILEHPGNPPPEQRTQMKESWEGRHKGARKSARTAIIWGGWKFVAVDGSFDPEKSQLLEQRRFNVEEVARWLNIPPHLLRDLSRSTYSNIEQQGIDFINYSIGPPLVNYEQEYDRKLLGGNPDLFTKHDLAGLTRGDRAARGDYNAKMIGTGVKTINEAREEDDLNPVEGGDVHFVPANLFTLDRAIAEGETVPGQGNQPAGGSAPTDTPPSDQPANDKPAPQGGQGDPSGQNAYNKARLAMQRLLASTLRRVAKVEANALRRAAQKAPKQFLAWLDAGQDDHRELFAAALEPVFTAAASLGLVVWDMGITLAEDWAGESHAQLAALADRCKAADLSREAELLALDWEGERPLRIADAMWRDQP